ncbi:DUF2510 domain-containing protein [Pseudolysinimonas sp.]|jgi:hypothetical protein|uniref:DUF2510 domain-containing protein n=1 Tax=Pseudolysinimonas sp. TaxID=2680009 RepID=UPI003783B22E
MSDVTPPAAGWYADPENPAGERWWNGSGWSDHKRDATVVAPVYSDPAPAPVETGFTFGSPASAGARPDPYAPPPAAQPYYGAPAAPYAPAPYAPAPYGAPAPGTGTNGLAIAGLIVSAAGWLILGGLAAIAGIILSAFGLSRARQLDALGHPNSGRGIALAGLVIGIVVFVISIIVVVVYIAFLMSYGYAS